MYIYIYICIHIYIYVHIYYTYIYIYMCGGSLLELLLPRDAWPDTMWHVISPYCKLV